jgi:hypothetical protein
MCYTKIYRVWDWIKQRCKNPNMKWYKIYWWRWITYDNKRETFEWFYEDMWPTYKKWLSIDRLDNNWNFNKENCRWATRDQQANNKRNSRLIEYKW